MASDTFPDYVYSSLIPGTRTFRAIRLLDRLRTWPPFLDRGTLHIEIEEVQIDSGCAYECLSYTWGVADGQIPDRRVIIETASGQRQLFIHRPLESALLQMMDNGNVKGLVFVDQICLDQHNNVEKADQVPLMQDIYAHSTRTLIWLGGGTRRSDCWFDFVQEIHADGTLSRLMGPNRGHFVQVFDAVMNPSISTSGVIREDTDDLRRLMDQYVKGFPLQAMGDVFKRSWFSRLWVIQEICLPSDVVVVCGTRTLCLDCFRGGNLFFSIYTSYLPNQVDRKVSKADLTLHWDVLQLSQGFIRIYQERRAIHVSGTRQNALDTVLRYGVADGAPRIGCSMPEDRIYGVMGLMAHDDDLHKMEVRYNNVVSVYTEFAALQVRRNLDILCYSQFPKQNDLHSWVPDWNMLLYTPRGYTKLGEPQFAAGTAFGHLPQAEVDLATGTLMVQGFMVDRITRVGKREFSQDHEPTATERIDDRGAQLCYGEIDEFLRLANEIPESRFQRYNPDDQRRADADIRLADHGLSERYLRDKGMPEEYIRVGLRAAKSQVARTGQMFLNIDERVRSYHIDRIFKTIGIVPWYWVPGGETDICRAMATNPIVTSLNWAKGAAMFLVDVTGLCLASSVTVGFSHWLRFRKQFHRLTLFPSKREENLRKHGLDAAVEHSEALSALNDFMLKNREQRLYVTEHGHIGLGPRTMQPDDVVVLFPGSTVPHVLRRTGERDDEEDGMWSYLGEAYCDGIMDGELLKDGDAAEARTFRIR